MGPIKYIIQPRAALHLLYRKRVKYFKDLIEAFLAALTL